jgi:hypothetical protein
MNDLNQHIDNAARFQQPPAQDVPIKDQSGNMNFALQFAQRQAAQPAPSQEPVRSLGAMPIPN